MGVMEYPTSVSGWTRQYLFIAHNDNHGLAAVQTRRIHPYRLSRE